MSDLISRQAAIDALDSQLDYLSKLDARDNPGIENKWYGVNWSKNTIADLPSAQPEYRLDEWCTDCKEYDTEKHCCPRFNQVIRTTLNEMKSERKKGKGKWNTYYHSDTDFSYSCNQCGYSAPYQMIGGKVFQKKWNFCPHCGADMRGEQDD